MGKQFKGAAGGMHVKVWCAEYNAIKRVVDGVIASFLPSCPTRSRFPFTSTSCCCPETTAALQWHVLAYRMSCNRKLIMSLKIVRKRNRQIKSEGFDFAIVT